MDAFSLTRESFRVAMKISHKEVSEIYGIVNAIDRQGIIRVMVNAWEFVTGHVHN